MYCLTISCNPVNDIIIQFIHTHVISETGKAAPERERIFTGAIMVELQQILDKDRLHNDFFSFHMYMPQILDHLDVFRKAPRPIGLEERTPFLEFTSITVCITSLELIMYE